MQCNGCDLKFKMDVLCPIGLTFWFFIKIGLKICRYYQYFYLYLSVVLSITSILITNFPPIIVLYRIKTNPKNAINEHFLPRFLDFIVWGHEHECLIDPQVS